MSIYEYTTCDMPREIFDKPLQLIITFLIVVETHIVNPHSYIRRNNLQNSVSLITLWLNI